MIRPTIFGVVAIIVVFAALAQDADGSGSVVDSKRADNPAQVYVTGSFTTVFSYEHNKCDTLDIPDAPARAYRKEDGTMVLIAAHYVNRLFVGSEFSQLRRDCKVVYEGGHRQDPALFDDRTWLTATWTENGRDITVLAHNEYQGQVFKDRCEYTSYSKCWYNSIVLVSSHNGGEAFYRIDGPSGPVATSPFKDEVSQGKPRGYFNPSNIIFNDGFYYAFIQQSGIEGWPDGPCLFRATDPGILGSWTVYNGTGFIPSQGSPYSQITKRSGCQPVEGLRTLVGSIAKIRATPFFVSFFLSTSMQDEIGGAVQFSLSSDLLHWSKARTILNISPTWSRKCHGGAKYNYPSALDPEAPGRNFDSIGQNAWLFLVRTDCDVSLKRDLVRVPILVKVP